MDERGQRQPPLTGPVVGLDVLGQLQHRRLPAGPRLRPGEKRAGAFGREGPGEDEHLVLDEPAHGGPMPLQHAFPVRRVRLGERGASGLGIVHVRPDERMVLHPRVVFPHTGPYDIGLSGPDDVQLGVDGRGTDRPGSRKSGKLYGPWVSSRSGLVRSSSRSSSRARDDPFPVRPGHPAGPARYMLQNATRPTVG
ncbi:MULTISPECIES: hypothetical protein [unclassified Streptomyces]|uniref:hypothetical protein n=1 Tax=unclassified Streptomyces TaxID=2593676 RepID=UPI0033B3EA1D